jgi:hypothetical protein
LKLQAPFLILFYRMVAAPDAKSGPVD